MRRDGTEILVALAINATEIDESPIFTATYAHHRAKAREEANRRLLRSLSLGDAIISMDLDETNPSWNKEAERLFGYTVLKLSANRSRSGPRIAK